MGIAQLDSYILIYEGSITCFTIVVLYNYCGIILYYAHISTVYYDTNLLSAVQTQDMGNLKREYGMLDKDRSGPFKSSQGEFVINRAFL